MTNLPVFGPIFNLLSSRKFWIAVMTIAADMLLKHFPELSVISPYGGLAVILIGALLILSIAAEDVAEKLNSKTKK